MRLSYLDRLNPEQRRAVEHGVGEGHGLSKRPLLVIAGAGSGKTATVAHRVAHLIVSGADPRRILLMTFSRRAAAEMTRRAERFLRGAMGGGTDGMAYRLTWAGTFHAVGARLLRIYANEIGLDPAFTIHDREDSADLLNLARHQLGFSKMRARFPMKGTVGRSGPQRLDRHHLRGWLTEGRICGNCPPGSAACLALRGC
jgi:DNA helicase-2/ATP-dependent DNA helicase PcrA